MKRRRHNFAATSGAVSRPALARGGFTLIELVLALALAGVIGGWLYSNMYAAFKARSSAEAAVEPSNDAYLAMHFVSMDMRNMLPPPNNSTSTIVQAFEATQGQDDRGHEADQVEFYTTADAANLVDSNGEIKNVELTVETDPVTGDHELVRRVLRDLLPPDGMDSETPATEVLCHGVWSFSLQYFTGSTWETSWDSQSLDNTLPVAVEVTLQLQRPGASGKQPQILTYTDILPISCSTAAENSDVNGDLGDTSGTSGAGGGE